MVADHGERQHEMGALEMSRRALLLFLFYLALALAAAGLAGSGLLNFLRDTRGVEAGPRLAPLAVGVNTDLEQYATPADLDLALALVKGAGFTAVRQTFPWREIEPARGTFRWDKWDRIVAQARLAGLAILPVLDTSPPWAQREYERQNPHAPPDDFAQFAAFAAAFAQRYHLGQYQIWDQPNVYPNWGERNANPPEYARLLRAAAAAIRAQEPGARIVLAGLAMNNEKERDRRNYNEVLFLRGLYEVNAPADFDVVAAKPYGLWSGPDDRRVSLDLLNFSRVILLHEEMRVHGDPRPLIGAEFGWNALPPGWRGAPSPWGTDIEPVQMARTWAALFRVRDEWPWMATLYLETLQPAAPPDDPRWGFALLDAQGQPQPAYDVWAHSLQIPGLLRPVPLPDRGPFYLGTGLLAAVALVAGWRALAWASLLPFAAAWRAIRRPFAALPEPVQFLILAAAVAGFYWAPRTDLTWLLLTLLVGLFALRPDLGLALVVFTIPFYLYPKALFSGFQMSLVEILTLVSGAGFAVRWTAGGTTENRGGGEAEKQAGREAETQSSGEGGGPRPAASRLFSALGSLLLPLDWAVLLLVALGALSLLAAENFGVANRELRVVVLEPALFYALVRLNRLDRAGLYRLVHALIAGALGVAAIGLYQYFFTDDVIVAEGVRRIHAVWGSPNNAALFLGRVVPLTLALALFYRAGSPASSQARSSGGTGGEGEPGRAHVPAGTGPGDRRVLYALAALPLLLVLFLTYSRGALLLGIPASLLFLAVFLGRRARWAVVGLLVAGALVLIPLATTERFQSLFQTGTGTGFFRVAVWTSALRMIRDHPILGIGLDNFLYQYPRYMLPEAWREPNLSHPHNLLLDWWTRLGIGGVVLLVGMLWQFFRRGLRLYATGAPEARWLALAVMASMVDFLAHGLIDAAYFLPDLAYVFMLSLAVVAQIEGAGHESARRLLAGLARHQTGFPLSSLLIRGEGKTNSEGGVGGSDPPTPPSASWPPPRTSSSA